MVACKACCTSRAENLQHPTANGAAPTCHDPPTLDQETWGALPAPAAFLFASSDWTAVGPSAAPGQLA